VTFPVTDMLEVQTLFVFKPLTAKWKNNIPLN